MILVYFLVLAAGFAALVKGADMFVDGSASLAKKFNVSELVIGLTSVALGTSAPEFDAKANGVFWGLRQEHDAIDMAGAVMEGVSFVLRKNCEHIACNGVGLTSIIATGGGAKSPIWC